MYDVYVGSFFFFFKKWKQETVLPLINGIW